MCWWRWLQCTHGICCWPKALHEKVVACWCSTTSSRNPVVASRRNNTFGKHTDTFETDTFGKSKDTCGTDTFDTDTFGTENCDSCETDTFGKHTDTFGTDTFGKHTDTFGSDTSGKHTYTFGTDTFGTDASGTFGTSSRLSDEDETLQLQGEP